jgi:hypothetical protein
MWSLSECSFGNISAIYYIPPWEIVSYAKRQHVMKMWWDIVCKKDNMWWRCDEIHCIMIPFLTMTVATTASFEAANTVGVSVFVFHFLWLLLSSSRVKYLQALLRRLYCILFTCQVCVVYAVHDNWVYVIEFSVFINTNLFMQLKFQFTPLHW